MPPTVHCTFTSRSMPECRCRILGCFCGELLLCALDLRSNQPQPPSPIVPKGQRLGGFVPKGQRLGGFVVEIISVEPRNYNYSTRIDVILLNLVIITIANIQTTSNKMALSTRGSAAHCTFTSWPIPECPCCDAPGVSCVQLQVRIGLAFVFNSNTQPPPNPLCLRACVCVCGGRVERLLRSNFMCNCAYVDYHAAPLAAM